MSMRKKKNLILVSIINKKANYMHVQVENILLPPNRKLVESLEDLITFALKIMFNIFENNHNQLFTCIKKVTWYLW